MSAHRLVVNSGIGNLRLIAVIMCLFSDLFLHVNTGTSVMELS